MIARTLAALARARTRSGSGMGYTWPFPSAHVSIRAAFRAFTRKSLGVGVPSAGAGYGFVLLHGKPPLHPDPALPPDAPEQPTVAKHRR